MRTKEENMEKEKELLSDEELLEVAAGRFPWGDPCIDQCKKEGKSEQECLQRCKK
ncbi:MAG: hypothetical protein RSC28_08605 [Bacteroidales bacterium]